MVVSCCAFGCTERAVKGGPVTFHCFPKDEERRKIWETKIHRENFKASKSSRLCSKHFSPDCFDREKFGGTWLIKTAVPTIFNFPKHLIERKITRKPLVRKTPEPEPVIEEGKIPNHEMYEEDDSSEPVLIHSDAESNKIQMENPALVEILMNEKFYPPEHLESLANGLPTSSKLKQKSNHALDGRIIALKECLHGKILLRSLKKQLLDAEIKVANAKRDYYEAKKAMLSQIQDAEDSDDSSDSETEPPLQIIKRRLEEEESAAKVEEKMLKEQLKEVQMHAANYEKDYYEAKSSMLSVS